MRTILPYFSGLLFVLLGACTGPVSDSAGCKEAKDGLEASIALFDKEAFNAADSLAYLTAEVARKSGCAVLWAKSRTLMANAELNANGADRSADSLLVDLAYAKMYHPEVAGIFHFWLGYTYLYKGEFWKALGHFEAARMAHEKGRIPVVAGNVGLNLYKPLANIYTRLGENSKAINLLQIARDSSIQQSDTATIPEIYNDLGLAFMNSGNPDNACDSYRTGLDFSFKYPSGDDNRIAEVRTKLLSNWADAKWRSGDPDSAQILARRSLAVDAENPEAFRILGEVENHNRDFRQADHFFTKAATIQAEYESSPDRELAKYLLRRARLMLDHNPKGADVINLCNQAIHCVIPKFKPANIFDNPDPAALYPENAITEALDLKSAALWTRYLRENRNIDLLRAADTTTALALQSVDTLTATYGFESSVLNSLDYTRALHERYFNILFERDERLHEPETPARIVAFSERSRALLLRQKLADDGALQTRGISSRLLEREKMLRVELIEQKTILVQMEADREPQDAIEQQKRRIFRLEDERSTIKKEIRRQSGVQGSDTGAVVVTLAAIQRRIASDTTMLVEYFYNPESGALYQIGITRHDVRLARNSLGSRNIEAFIAFVRDETEAKERTDTDPTYLDQFVRESKTFYDSLLAPLAGNMPLRELIVVPDGILGAFPFDLLLTRSVKPDETTFRQLPYLFRTATVRFAASATVLLQDEHRATRSPSAGYLGIAPAYQSNTFPWVEYGGDCVSALRALYKGQYLKGFPATKDRFRALATGCQILHFYGHGRADNNTPGRSYLAFTSLTGKRAVGSGILAAASQLPAVEVPNVLYAQEISLMHLNADLAVLSACETGVGKVVGGEGVLSLARAFLDAGCPSAAMTLWSVDDEATDQLTQSFLRHIREGKRKDIALQLAKKEFLESGKSAAPYYWSGFVLTGDASPLKSVPDDCYFALRGQTYPCSAVWAAGLMLLVVLALLTAIFRYRHS